jgi:Fur family ferric uptake transcriptional regulator
MTTSGLQHTEYLHRFGIKSTRQRNAVLDVLIAHDGIQTAGELYQAVVRTGELVNFSTVYRILELFQEKGLVEKSTFPGSSQCVFSLRKAGHSHHLICLGCKKTITISKCPLAMFEQGVAEDTGFTIVGHDLELYGYCPECQKKRNKK